MRRSHNRKNYSNSRSRRLRRYKAQLFQSVPCYPGALRVISQDQGSVMGWGDE